MLQPDVRIPLAKPLCRLLEVREQRLRRVCHAAAARINSRGLRPWRAAVLLFPAFSDDDDDDATPREAGNQNTERFYCC